MTHRGRAAPRRICLGTIAATFLTATSLLTGSACIATAEDAVAAPRTVVYPDFRGRAESGLFAAAVLKAALERAPGNYRLVKSDRGEMTQSRAILALERGRLDVLWAGTSRALEQRLRAVYVPITRGLLGHRLLVIRADRQPVFSAIETLDDLRALIGGQGQGWSDTKILRAAGLDIVTSSFDNLFRMVEAGHIDYYPLGANEVYSFVADYKEENPNIAVERDLVLVYKFDFLFFVRPGDDELHAAIRNGLDAMYADGSYIELYNNHPEVAAYLARADLDTRRRFELPNPVASDALRRIPDRYWRGGP